MPEGPSIIIARDDMKAFIGKKVIEVGGNSKLDIQRLAHKKLMDIKTWGKHLLLCFSDVTVRIHFMLFGSYLVNEKKKAKPALSLVFNTGELNFYTSSIKFIEEDLDDVYDWSADIMSDKWSPTEAKKKLKKHPGMLACDALLAQDIFSGSGNIIKNEVLYRIKVHPESKVGALPAKQVNDMVKEARKYAFDFLKWKQHGELKKHWLAHTKTHCHRCDLPIIKEYLGKTHRRTYYCDNCQVLYT